MLVECSVELPLASTMKCLKTRIDLDVWLCARGVWKKEGVFGIGIDRSVLGFWELEGEGRRTQFSIL